MIFLLKSNAGCAIEGRRTGPQKLDLHHSTPSPAKRVTTAIFFNVRNAAQICCHYGEQILRLHEIDHARARRQNMTLFDFCTRRRFVRTALTAATALELQRAAIALGFSTKADVCKLTAEQETGPYYLEDEMLRSNISEDKPGVPLSLKIIVMDARTCTPITGAALDLWHCDAGGVYSGFTKPNRPDFDPRDRGFENGPPGGFGPAPSARSTDKLTFLRGIQMTAADGSVHFQTVFPGVYMGRTNHVHFKVRLGGSIDGTSYQAGHTSHTGQVFFPEEIAASLMQSGPYAKNPIRRTKQSEDMVFGEQHGESSIATLRPRKLGQDAEGFEAELVACVDPLAQPAPIGPGGRRRGPPPTYD
jgi:protocatechuate 3,4-dioxygenase beta subunit